MSLVHLTSRMSAINRQTEHIQADMQALYDHAEQRGGMTAIDWSRCRDMWELTAELSREFDRVEKAVYEEIGAPVP